MTFYMKGTAYKYTNTINSSEERVLIISATISLQRLRLISRIWAKVVPYFLFDVVRLQTPGMARRLLEDWQGSILSSADSPLRVLSMEHLVCHKPADSEVFVPESVRAFVSMPIDTGAKVINTFGINITSLSLIFGNCMMVSTDMIDAVKNIHCLTKLTLIRRYDWPRKLNSDSASIGDLLTVTPALESLSLSLPYLESHFLLPGSLPCLKHLWFKYHTSSREAITQISHTTKRTLRTIEYNSADPVEDAPSGILREARNSLECLCIDAIAINLPPSTWCFQTLRTIVTKYSTGHDYWMDVLRLIPDGHFPRPNNFKHIVFTSCRGRNLLNDEMVCAFDKYDIQCHFMAELEYDEILQLNSELNGPMQAVPEDGLMT
ncbi:uncharacterized protein MELLADRAFT_107561 [Melampsora larici-populina 98AG31]|uniref:F-box domain-containing protein n=1 Tax=Melampsora larici-populina (strain 98AG31 / pathotype 3-4-7) TaxID=747676 RepID=F4RQ21_MELLP|nr:uncharacterized protein MELLADRAFT_107561 [Melampsora larici-populina 98AG31]EGG05329.1 hypothetical protein MELLADRAFT_107561 [Melampsora larici-populina 98AG31]